MSDSGQTQRPTALITGATSGIGRGLAERFAQDGYELAVVARNETRLTNLRRDLESTYGVPVSDCPQDLAEPSAVETLLHHLTIKNVDVDVLVNNAGFGTYGPFVETGLTAQLEMIQVHVQALTELTHRLLPSMIDRGQGRILNVASTAAFQPGPSMAVYFATKAYVLSLSEALHAELRPHGVSVTALCPGPTSTPFLERASMERSGLTHRQLVMDVDPVVDAGYRGLMNGKRVVVPGWKNKLGAFLARRAPQRLVLAIAHRLVGRT